MTMLADIHNLMGVYMFAVGWWKHAFRMPDDKKIIRLLFGGMGGVLSNNYDHFAFQPIIFC